MLAALLEEKPKVVSFHFGVPAPERVRALRDAGIILLASATNPNEAQAVADAGIHAVVAQCNEAGGHRGVFDTDAPDSSLGTIALTRLLVRQLDIPVIAAGGICRLAKRISLTQLRKVLGPAVAERCDWKHHPPSAFTDLGEPASASVGCRHRKDQ
jgi:Nitronate monooxygenase